MPVPTCRLTGRPVRLPACVCSVPSLPPHTAEFKDTPLPCLPLSPQVLVGLASASNGATSAAALRTAVSSGKWWSICTPHLLLLPRQRHHAALCMLPNLNSCPVQRLQVVVGWTEPCCPAHCWFEHARVLQVPRETVIGLFRDLRGVALATNSRRTYGEQALGCDLGWLQMHGNERVCGVSAESAHA